VRPVAEAVFPRPIGSLILSLSSAGFFERSILIGSWVMAVYGELYGVSYVLRTLDLDFAVEVAHPRVRLRADVEGLISGLGFTGFFAAGGWKKFTGEGYEVEFFVHRSGGRNEEPRALPEWGINALPLPFIRMLLDFSQPVALDTGASFRIPRPEAYFLHKLLISPPRQAKEKGKRDLDQCAALMGVLDHDTIRKVLASLRLGPRTRRVLTSSAGVRSTYSTNLRNHRLLRRTRGRLPRCGTVLRRAQEWKRMILVALNG